MQLKFLGRKIKACGTCSGGHKVEPRFTYSLYSPFGIQKFQRGKSYEFAGEVLEFWKEAGYFLDGIKYLYFRPC